MILLEVLCGPDRRALLQMMWEGEDGFIFVMGWTGGALNGQVWKGLYIIHYY